MERLRRRLPVARIYLANWRRLGSYAGRSGREAMAELEAEIGEIERIVGVGQ